MTRECLCCSEASLTQPKLKEKIGWYQPPKKSTTRASKKSIRQFKTPKLDEHPQPQPKLDGLTCMMCKQIVCIDCIRKINKEITEEDVATDKWCRYVRTFCTAKTQNATIDIGHCCELKVQHAQWKEGYKTKTPSTDSYDGYCSYDGHLVLPQMGLMIDSPAQDGLVVDIHAFGDGETGLEPLLHGVVTREVALKANKEKVKARAMEPTRKETGSITLDLGPICTKKEIAYEILHYAQSDRDDSIQDMKGTHPTLEDIQSCSLLPELNTDLDVSLVVGSMKKSNQKKHLLLARWHKPLIQDSKLALDDAKKLEMFESLKSTIGHGGFEVSRRGGSSGKVAFNDNLMKFIAHPSNFPRDRRGVKLIPYNKEWKCIYINEKKEAKKHSYSNPIPGGQVNMKAEYLDKFPVLKNFFVAKIASAYLLKKVAPKVQPKAAMDTICTFEKAISMTKKQSCRCIHVFAILNQCTLVMHPVGYHIDNFKGKQASLENKVCFALRGYNGYGFGRGGGTGKRLFTFALLDWRDEVAGKRRKAYLAMGGDSRKNVTATVWEEFAKEKGFDPNEIEN